LIPALKLALLFFNLILIPVKVLANALYKLFEPLEPVVQSISDAFDGINSKIEEAVQFSIPLGVILLKIAAPIDFMFRIFRMLSPTVGAIGTKLQTIGGTISRIASGFGKVGGVIGRVGGLIGKMGGLIVSMSTKMSLLGATGSVLTPIFTTTMKVFGKISRYASGLLGPIRGFITGFGSASGVVGKFASGFGKVGRIVGILGTAGKAIPIIGEVIMVLQAAYGMITRLMSGMGFFDALGETLYDVFVGPFEMLVDLLSKIPIIGKLFEAIKPVFGMIKSGFSSVFGFIQKIFDGGFSGLWDKIVNGAKSFVSMIGSALLIGIKLFGSRLYEVFIQPFVSAWTFISDLFVGKSNSTLGDGIIKGLIGVGSTILKIFTSPFETIFQIIMTGFTSIATFIQTALSIPFKIVGKLIGVDTGGIGAEAGSSVQNQDGMISAIQETNQKLDTLIGLMMSGGIAVNLDGRKVSEQLAIASS
jgi:hypothetical protein